MTALALSQQRKAVACHLAGEDMADREQEWRALGASALRARTVTPTGLRLEFDAGRETAHALIDLLAAERECCGWASWSLTSTASAVVIEVEAENLAVQILHTMFGNNPQQKA